jgi:hypothetical protein
MNQLRLLLICLTFSQLTFATILPENNFAIPITDKKEGLTEAQYNAVIDKVAAVYRPILEDNGYSMSINRLWTDPRVNAGTTKKGTELIFNMYGGYARHSMVTEDGYALVMCHELGHHLGGTPKKIFDNGEEGWPSVEGQADYFATLKCLRKVFRKDNNQAVLAGLEIPGVIIEKCIKGFKEKWEVDICIRTSLAGLSVGAVSADIRNTEVPTVETSDATVVEKTYEAHPLPQCRLDTYFQGSICEVSSARPLTTKDETKGACHTILGHQEGTRPNCWFKSSK